MKLVDVSVARPIFIIMLSLALVVVGAVSMGRMGIDLLPNLEIPIVTISVTYGGASPEVMETQVIKPIEEAISSINGVKTLTSTGYESAGFIMVEFKDGVKPMNALQDVREKISAARATLPDGVDEPVISRVDMNSSPILAYGVTGNMDANQLRDLVDKKIKRRLEQVNGAGEVGLYGGLEREIQIRVSDAKLKAYGLSILQVLNALKTENVEVPGGRQTVADKEVLVRTKGKATDIEELGRILIAKKKGTPICLRDVAEVVDSHVEQRVYAKMNGKSAVIFMVKAQSGANTVQVADDVKDEIAKVVKELPADVQLRSLLDSSQFIKASNNEVKKTLLEGALLAVLIVFLFLRDWRSTVISAITLPVSIIGTFAALQAAGLTMNLITMMALSLSVGVLIDDAIVVIENIHRKMQEGLPPKEAVIKGAEEIGLAVMATTLTIVVVFLPMIFINGMVGKIFGALGLTIVSAVLISLFVAFTLTPSLAARMLKNDGHKANAANKPNGVFAKLSDGIEKTLEGLDHFYASGIKFALRRRFLILFGAFLALALSIGISAKLLHTGAAPDFDSGQFSINLETPSGTGLDVTAQRVKEVEKVLLDKKAYPEIKTVFSIVGMQSQPTNGMIVVRLVPKKERSHTTNDLREKLRVRLATIPGIKARIAKSTIAAGMAQDTLEFHLLGSDYKTLYKISKDVLKELAKNKGIVDVKSSYTTGKPEYAVKVDRERAADLGVSVSNVAVSINTAITGSVPSKFKGVDDEYDIRVQMDKADRENIEQTLDLNVPDGEGKLIPIREVASVTNELGPSQVTRLNRERDIKITAEVQGITAGDATNYIKETMGKIKLPDGYKWMLKGDSDTMNDVFVGVGIALLLAIIFIYMVLASQFESLIHPFTIMFSLPLALVGALLALIVFAKQLDMMSMIGILLLMGLVTKNAILLIDYTILLRSRGMSKFEALVNAGRTRLRPILMTTLAMIFGMLPTAMGNGEGVEYRAGMGIVIIGGLITSTLLTLVVVPVVYSLFDDISKKFSSKKNKTVEIAAE